MNSINTVPIISIPTTGRKIIIEGVCIKPGEHYTEVTVEIEHPIILGFKTKVTERAICDGEHMGSFTWGSSRITYWRLSKGIHRCFNYKGYSTIHCGDIIVYYNNTTFPESLYDEYCRTLNYIRELLDSKPILVEKNNTSISTYNNIIVTDKPSKEAFFNTLVKILVSKRVREDIARGLIFFIDKNILTPHYFRVLVDKITRNEYVIDKGNLIVEMNNGDILRIRL